LSTISLPKFALAFLRLFRIFLAGAIVLQNFIYYQYYSMTTGIVKFFNRTKDFGFITPEDGSKDVFVHGSNVIGEAIADGDTVTFEVGEGRKGPEAKNVTKIASAQMEMAA
jgi:CspA family cold shock protein